MNETLENWNERTMRSFETRTNPKRHDRRWMQMGRLPRGFGTVYEPYSSYHDQGVRDAKGRPSGVADYADAPELIMGQKRRFAVTR